MNMMLGRAGPVSFCDILLRMFEANPRSINYVVRTMTGPISVNNTFAMA